MKARIENNTIVEIVKAVPGFALEQCFHPDIIAACIDIPEGASVGWQKNDQDEWVAPPPPPRKWSADDVRNGLTLAEKVNWDNNSFKEIVTAKKELESPVDIVVIAEILEMLVSATAITRASMEKILA